MSARQFGSGRKPRADAQRNRERLLEAAKAAFTAEGTEASLEEIARRAGVGIGTLYRHFPTRDAMVAAVYRNEVEQLGAAAERLLATLPPGEALHRWMRLAVDYIATKKLMASALNAMVGGTAALYATSAPRFTEAMKLLVERAKASGDIRADVDSDDLLRALVGFTYATLNPGGVDPDWRDSALRLVDV
ncbi:MAG: TetR/AcrR family transcriptional regulator, partial [Proteobacteria bacterium]|nr:TetR/AcrR family transcriptional regulator [Pseudomonadota bacterium]